MVRLYGETPVILWEFNSSIHYALDEIQYHPIALRDAPPVSASVYLPLIPIQILPVMAIPSMAEVFRGPVKCQTALLDQRGRSDREQRRECRLHFNTAHGGNAAVDQLWIQAWSLLVLSLS